MTDRDKAWLAGFLEARGRLSWDKTNFVRIRMSGLDSYLQSEFKYISKCPKMPKHKGTVTISGRSAMQLLVDVFLFASPRFQVRIQEYVTHWNMNSPGARKRYFLPEPPPSTV